MSRKDQLNALFGLRPGAAAPPAPETKGAAAPAAGSAPVLGAPNNSPGGNDGAPPPSAPRSEPRADRVRAGAVGAMGATLQQLAQGERLRDLDPSLIDPAPVGDRIASPVDESFDALKASIAASGQQVPVLVREHPSAPGRYQAAYGHRRIRAARELGLTVRAEIRALGDEALAVAQGQENIARRDLSFIEKALFAAGLERAGLPRAAILKALATDKGDLSRYLAVAASVPDALVRLIGPAPKAGRARWLALADALAAAGWRQGGPLPARLQALWEKAETAAANSDERFALALAALTAKAAPPAVPRLIHDQYGAPLASLAAAGARPALTLDAAIDPGFAAFLADELPALYRRWRAAAG
jgi:ParB family chromosome partitioning protein